MKEDFEKKLIPEEPTYEEFMRVCERFDWLSDDDREILESMEGDLAGGLGYLFGVKIDGDGLLDAIDGDEEKLERMRVLESEMEVELYKAGFIEKPERFKFGSDNKSIEIMKED